MYAGGDTMKYDFTTIYTRNGMDALAVDAIGKESYAPKAPAAGYDVIPMWVADMNFATAPSVTSAIEKRLAHPLFGYFEPSEKYERSIIDWQIRQNGTTVTKDQIGYENGVLGGAVSALQALIKRGGKVMLHSPYYVGFIGMLKNAGFKVITSPLVRDSVGKWRMDYQDMEEKLRTENIDAFLFCSPHNPSGRVWEKWEIEQAMQLIESFGIPVISDEIWSDLILPGHKHVPTQSVSPYAREHTVALYAPTKTFNLAGLTGGYHVVFNRDWQEKILKKSQVSHYNHMNVLFMHALIGAYSEEGNEWLQELLQVIDQNITFACDFLEKELPDLAFSRPEGTYMLFVDVSRYMEKSGRSMDEILEQCWRYGVAVQNGREFGNDSSIRINLASPFEMIKKAFRRMREYVFY